MYSTEGTFAHQGEALLARRPAQRGRVGVFGVAHGVYFRQFDGLREKLQGYYEEFLGLVGQEEVEVLDYGMVDSVENGREALEKMRRDDPDILLCDMVTYATSSVFDPIIRGARDSRGASAFGRTGLRFGFHPDAAGKRQHLRCAGIHMCGQSAGT